MCEKSEQICGQGDDLTAYDIQALTGAAKFFEDMATGADPAPLAFAQSIRRALPIIEMMVEMDGSEKAPLSAEEEAGLSAVVDGAWQRFVESMPAARVIDDNQPDNQAIIQVLRDPPTLPVGTVLFASYRGMADNFATLQALEAAERAEKAVKGTDGFAAILNGQGQS